MPGTRPRPDSSPTTGVALGLVYTPIVQVGSENGRLLATHELDFAGAWTVETPLGPGQIYWVGAWTQTYTELSVAGFARSQGRFSLPTDRDTSPDRGSVAPEQLAWVQRFGDSDQGAAVRLGQLDAQGLFGVNDPLNNDLTSFIAQPLAAPYGASWMDRPYGLGAAAAGWRGPWYAALGVQDAAASQTTIDVRSFFEGRYAVHAEVAYETDGGGERPGAYRLSAARISDTGTGAENRTGWALVASAQQRVADDFRVFARFARTWERRPERYRAVTGGGLLWDTPFDFAGGVAGIAYAFAQPADPADADEHGLELYWRFQATHRVQVTPDVQVWWPANAGGVRVVVGLRMRVGF